MNYLLLVVISANLLLVVSGLRCYSTNGQMGLYNPNNNNNKNNKNEEQCYQSRFCVKREGILGGRYMAESGCEGEQDALFPGLAGQQFCEVGRFA
jgi:hypothetical protein